MGVALLDEFGIGDAQAREEAWRHSKTALRALAQNDFARADAHAPLPADLLARIDWAQTRGQRLVFVNGAFAPEHSNTAGVSGVAIEHSGDSITLTLAQAERLHLVFANLPGTQPTRWNAALHLRVRAPGVSIVEQHVGEAGADVLGALRSTLEVGEHAGVSVTTLCDLPDSVSLYRRDAVSVAGGAAYASTNALFGGRLQRHDVAVELGGAYARHSARGVFALRGRQHVDVHLDVRHAARDTASDVVWRGVADQRARGILHGAITVAPGADGADARLQTKNLLLSPHAEIDAQPVLEIYADEVKASHGATVGQLDERALFYLRTRGVPAATARSLLIGGFCREVFGGLDDADLRAGLEAILDARLPAAGAAP
jgi:Fe-S cluster assembly protein SufD